MSGVLRLAKDRGHVRFDWLDTWHTFSFGDYYDPRHMGVSVLRVINDDTVAPGTGFDTHGHRDMEIITYLLDGVVEHQDSMGNKTHITAGEIQVMSAGTGVRHSEHNPSPDRPLHLLQLWIMPKAKGLLPRYEQADFSERTGISLVVSPDGKDGSLRIQQDAEIYKVVLNKESAALAATLNRTYYLHVVRGGVCANDFTLTPGDGLTLTQTRLIELRCDDHVEALLFNLPA